MHRGVQTQTISRGTSSDAKRRAVSRYARLTRYTIKATWVLPSRCVASRDTARRLASSTSDNGPRPIIARCLRRRSPAEARIVARAGAGSTPIAPVSISVEVERVCQREQFDVPEDFSRTGSGLPCHRRATTP